mgnify:CR=1 FL=1
MDVVGHAWTHCTDANTRMYAAIHVDLLNSRGNSNPPPPMVFVFPVIDPTMQTRADLAFFMSSMRRLANRK